MISKAFGQLENPHLVKAFELSTTVTFKFQPLFHEKYMFSSK